MPSAAGLGVGAITGAGAGALADGAGAGAALAGAGAGADAAGAGAGPSAGTGPGTPGVTSTVEPLAGPGESATTGTAAVAGPATAGAEVLGGGGCSAGSGCAEVSLLRACSCCVDVPALLLLLTVGDDEAVAGGVTMLTGAGTDWLSRCWMTGGVADCSGEGAGEGSSLRAVGLPPPEDSCAGGDAWAAGWLEGGLPACSLLTLLPPPPHSPTGQADGDSSSLPLPRELIRAGTGDGPGLGLGGGPALPDMQEGGG